MFDSFINYSQNATFANSYGYFSTYNKDFCVYSIFHIVSLIRVVSLNYLLNCLMASI